MQARLRDPRSWAAILFTLNSILAAGGCDTADFASPVASGVPRDITTARPFPPAISVDLPAAGEVFVNGAVTSADDAAVFALGPVHRGDRIIVDVSGDNGINLVAALFNAAGELILLNDDRSYYGGQLDPFIGVIVREDTDNALLGVAVSRARYFASAAGRYSSGTFRARIRRDPGNAIRINPQIVWLEYGGAAGIRIAQEAPIDIPPFDAGRIFGSLSGATELIKDAMVARMAADFAGLNVTLLRSDRDAPPAGDFTRMYIGGSSDRFLGLSDNVDSYNGNVRQESIIFADALRTFDYLNPRAEDVAQALANVASHELGHLLGLQHTGDPNDIMAPAASAHQVFFIDASFGVAPLADDLFPIGVQNDFSQLLFGVGPAGELAAAPARVGRIASRGAPPDAAPAAQPLICRHGAICLPQ